MDWKLLYPVGSVWEMPNKEGKLIVLCYVEDNYIGVFIVPDKSREEYYPNTRYLSLHHINPNHYFHKRLNEPVSIDKLLTQGRYNKEWSDL